MQTLDRLRAISQFVVHLSKRGTSPDFARGKNISIQNANTIALLAALTSSSYVVSSFLSNETILIIVSVISFVSYIGSYLLISNRFFDSGRIFLFLSANISIFLTNDIVGRESLIYFYFFATTAAPFLVFDKEEGRLIAIAVGMGLICWLASNYTQPHFFMISVHNPAYYSPLVPVLVTPLLLVFVIRQTQSLYHRTLKELEISKLELVHAAKMATIGEFAGGLAHEINNPLTIIEGYSSLVRKKLESADKDIEAIDDHLLKIENTVRKIAKVISGLRSFARIDQQIDREIVNTKWLLDYSLDMCGDRIKSMGIDIIIESVEEIEILARPMQLTQVIVNLLNNSADAIEGNSEKWIRVRCHKENNFYHIELSDSGRGIPTAVAQKMMQPFFTTKPVGKGTGLGLAISKGLIEDHGGCLIYDSKSENTKFIVQLPIDETIAKKAV